MVAPRDDGRLVTGLVVGVGDFDRKADLLPADLARETTVKAKRPVEVSAPSSTYSARSVPSTGLLTAVQAWTKRGMLVILCIPSSDMLMRVICDG